MIRQTSSDESAFSEYVSLLLELHKLIAAGEGDSDDADEVRDRMDGPWRQLNAGETRLVDGLSTDLYSLGVEREAPDEYTGDAAEFARYKQAIEDDQWLSALEVIRSNEQHFPLRTTAFLRGVCWAHLNEPDTAILFLEESARLHPLAPEEEVWLLGCLTEADRSEEALDRAREISRSSQEPLLLLQSSIVFFSASTCLTGDDAVAVVREAIDVSERALAAADAAPADESLNTMQASVFLHLAITHDAFGDAGAAVAACEKALQIDPSRKTALELRGFLSYRGFPANQRAPFRHRLQRELIAEPRRSAGSAIAQFT